MFETFEKKVKEIKDNTSKSTKVITVVIILGVIVMLLLNMIKLYKIKEQKLEDSYNNAMYQLIDYSKQIEALLAKARITTTKRECVITYTDILRQANLASTSLFLLPVDQNKLQNMAKYFAQVSDYSLSLSNKLLLNDKISDNDYSNLQNMESYSVNLVNVLTEIYSNLNDGTLKWNELENELNEELQENKLTLATKNVKKLSETFTEYEGLIYDGAYSDHTTSSIPKMLVGKNVSIDSAKEKVKDVVLKMQTDKKHLKQITDIKYTGETGDKVILYNFEVMLKGSREKMYVQITKNTGLVYLIMYDRNVKKNVVGIDKSKAIGLNYLKSIGIDNMESTYYMVQNNMITINYASMQDNVIMYPDLIKVKIALDTGEICSLESKGYIYNHANRDNVYPKLSEEMARQSVNKSLEISNSRLAVIQTDSKKEVLTYEFVRQNRKKGFSNIHKCQHS